MVLAQGHWLTSKHICRCTLPSQPHTLPRPGQLLQASRGEQATTQTNVKLAHNASARTATDQRRQKHSTQPKKGPTNTNRRNKFQHNQLTKEQQHVAERRKPLTPIEMTGYIKEEWQAAAHIIRKANPDLVLSQYCQRMDELCSNSQRHLNYVHMSAILYGIGQIYLTAAESHVSFRLRQDPDLGLQAFLSRMLVIVQQILPSVGCREASSILWSFAKMGIHPDTLVLDIVDGLATRFTEDIGSAKGQSYSSMLLACRELNLNPCQGGMLSAIVQGLSSTDTTGFSAQAIGNITYCLATMLTLQPTAQLLDALCSSFLFSMQSEKRYNRPSPQAIAHFVKSLQQLKHLPQVTITDALLNRMLAFCYDPEQRLDPREISNFLLAYADMRCVVTQKQADVLFAQLLGGPRANTQDLANAAWAAAVLGCLQPHTFGQILHYLSALKSSLNQAHMVQLYQALDWLSVPSDALQQHSTEWAELETKLQELCPRPAVEPSTSDLRGSQAMSAALIKLGLNYSVGVPVKGYWMHAVVQPHLGTAPNLLIACIVAPDCFSNQPARLTGRAMFWHKLLAQEGTVVDIPLKVAEQGVEALTDHLEPKLEAAAGGTLDAYRS